MSIHSRRVESALALMAPGYRELFDASIAVFESDERFRALWLSGSLARGMADSGSDLDLIVAVRDADFDSYADQWRDWLSAITEPLIARELPGKRGCFNSTNRDCLRLDVVAEPVSAMAELPYRRRLVVFDRDGLDATVPEPGPAPGPDLVRIESIVEEAFRRVAIFPQAVVARKDWLLGIAGINGHRELLYDVFVEANQPLPPMGLKQWSAKLTTDQRAVLVALPAVAADRDSVVEGMRATIDAWNNHGQVAVESAGAVWPIDVASTVTDYFYRSLSLAR